MVSAFFAFELFVRKIPKVKVIFGFLSAPRALTRFANKPKRWGIGWYIS